MSPIDPYLSLLNSPSTLDIDAILPEPLQEIPRAPLLLQPSPIQHLPRISQDLHRNRPSGTPVVQIYAKREDLSSGFAFGGNKVRKLEYLVSDALDRASPADTLVSIGGIQSNHTRQVAAVARAVGLKAHVIRRHWAEWEDGPRVYDKVGNVQLADLMGTEATVPATGVSGGAMLDGDGRKGDGDQKEEKDEEEESVMDTTESSQSVRELFAQLRERGQRPYWIPAGASDHPLGGLGFARWAFEVREQERVGGVFFDTIFCCAVTGSTLAGMIAGFKFIELRLEGRPRRVIGIDASAEPEKTFERVLKIARSTATKIGLKESDVSESDVVIDRRYAGPAYGVPDRQTVEAIRYGARMEAFITDPVYEGKTFAGLMDMVRNGEVAVGNVLFAHLGGQVALNAYSDMEERVLGTRK